MTAPAIEPARESLGGLFLIFLRLGLTSFGGPIAHLGFFRDEFVTRRRWLGERAYADLVALCQFLPGPASSQVGMAIGLARHGYRGALAAWAGFTLPSALAMILFALGLARHGDLLPAGALHGLKIVAVAVVAQAVWGMARSLCPDAPRVTLLALAACTVLALPSAGAQVGVIAAAGLVGLVLLRPEPVAAHEPLPLTLRRRAGVFWLALFFALLVGLPILARLWPAPALTVTDAFFRAGALVFGGGHVVLPLLQAAVVPPGWVDAQTFLAGYGAAQAVPGPLFTFAAFLGASMKSGPSGWPGGLLCLAAIFAPSFLLVAGALPFWERLRRAARMRSALAGINAAVVGLLLAALYDPVWVQAIGAGRDFALALVAFVALVIWKLPPWLVVLGCGAAGAVPGLGMG
ncbi:chromate efflux transporter [Immundisolibacter sp.]|uniref:chromate efflux transporter n=1 Tax=Immundisolibacter sp. TaxID=1934948 RepID=UPI00260B19DB|nr:chromate efflux transporter [Immundisolibacter sp.]MDD3651524.1 chromate efflux transporter [Immundisolibacter sp.]